MSQRPTKKLQAEWRAKLKKSGFEDIEDSNGNIDRGSWDFRTSKVMNSYKTKLDYYYQATQFLNDYMFDNILDKVIWTYHVEAIGVRDIAKLLPKLKLKKMHYTAVFQIVKRLNKEMKEFYLNREPNVNI